MSYATVERQIRVLPEECLEDVSSYIEFLMFRKKKAKDNQQENDLGKYFGSLANLPDGLEFQKEVRDEWK